MQAREMFSYLIGTVCLVKGERRTVTDVVKVRGELYARLDSGQLAHFAACKFV